MGNYRMQHKTESRPESQSGFTMIELLVVIAIIGVVATIATPQLRDVRANMYLRSATSDFFIKIQRAKVEAIRSNTSVSVVFFKEVAGVDNAMVAFFDRNNDLILDVDEEVIETIDLKNYGGSFVFFDTVNHPPDGVTFAKNAEGLPAFRFTTRGMPKNSSGGFVTGYLYLINKYGSRKSIFMNQLGSVKVGG